MPAAPETMTAQQKAWMASIRDNLVKETGKSLDEWASIARACPETKHRARLAWMKEHHGLGQNRASVVLGIAFPSEAGWNTPDALADDLWKDEGLRAIFGAIRAEITTLPDVVIGQRKTYSAFSRAYQFAAARPDKGAVLLGLAVEPDAAPGLSAPRRPVWSERLKAEARLTSAEEIAHLAPLIRQAWERS
jgi:predicted transport protein